MDIYKGKCGDKCTMCEKSGFHINFVDVGKEVACPHCTTVAEPKLCDGFAVKDHNETIIKHDGKVYYCMECTNLFALGCKHGINGCTYNVHNSILFTSYEENADGISVHEPLKLDTLKQFMTTMGNYKLTGVCSCALDSSKEDIECEKALYRGKIKNGPTDYSIVDLFEDKYPFNPTTTYTIMLVCNKKNSKSAWVVDFMKYLSQRSDIQFEVTINPMEKNITLELSSIAMEEGRTIECTMEQVFYPNGLKYIKCSPSYVFTPLYVTNITDNGEFEESNPYKNKHLDDSDFNCDSISELLEEY